MLEVVGHGGRLPSNRRRKAVVLMSRTPDDAVEVEDGGTNHAAGVDRVGMLETVRAQPELDAGGCHS